MQAGMPNCQSYFSALATLFLASIQMVSAQSNNNAWKAIDFAFYTAKQKGIRIIAPLVDCYSWYNGSYKHFTDTRGINKNDFWTNMDVRNDFKKFINLM